jgi:hypothetical protein
MNYWKGSGIKHWWPNAGVIPEFTNKGGGRPLRTSVRTTDVPAEIQITYLPN